MFAFAVRRLKWLARIPGAPQVFNAVLLAASGLFYPARLRAMSEVESAVCRWDGMRSIVHRLGGVGFVSGGRESSHMHGNGLLDCFVGRADRDRLVESGDAVPHHVFQNSGWISFWIEDEEDVEPAIALIRIAVERK